MKLYIESDHLVGSVETRNAGTRSSHRRIGFTLISVVLGLIISLSISEIVFRVLERRENSKSIQEGSGGRWFADGRWGWKPTKGDFHVATSEFDVRGHINALYMNDKEFDARADQSRTRIFALGDSHTYAVGVSTEQAWPKVLEWKLNLADEEGRFRVYNGGVSGYNMHQYLLRLIDQGPLLRPDFVVLGLSYATDLYDLLPPERGGWIYGDNKWPRDYFDFDQFGGLAQRRWEGQEATAGKHEVRTSPATFVRELLDNTAIFRYLRRSNLALTIGSRVRIGGQSLWPNMEVVLEKDTNEQHKYQWRLFEALLLRINEETIKQRATLIVVGIPYLPQVYDDLWERTFGTNPKYSRTVATERVALFCKANGILYVETLGDFQNKYKTTGTWLHYRKDAHPTPQGQELIADAVLKTVTLTPVKRASE